MSMETGKDFRLFCHEVHLGSTENINKRSPGAPSYYFCQNEILYSQWVDSLLSKFFILFYRHLFLYSLWGRKSFHLATVKLCTSCSQTADRKAWSLKSEMKFISAGGVRKYFLTGLNELYLPITVTVNLAQCDCLYPCPFHTIFFIPWSPALPAVRDFTRDSRWSTYDVRVRKKMWGKMRTNRIPSKATTWLPPPTNLAQLGHFPPASQAGRLAGPVFYVYVFLCM